VSQHQSRPLKPLDHSRHGIGLPAARDAQQRLKPLPRGETVDEAIDRLGLVARGRIGRPQDERPRFHRFLHRSILPPSDSPSARLGSRAERHAGRPKSDAPRRYRVEKREGVRPCPVRGEGAVPPRARRTPPFLERKDPSRNSPPPPRRPPAGGAPGPPPPGSPSPAAPG